MIVVSLAFVVPIFLHQIQLRALPVVVAEIIVGLIIGKSGFDLVSEDPWLELLSLFGFIYLMFLSGLEIDFSTFSKNDASGENRFRPIRTAIYIFIGIFVLSLGIAMLLVVLGFIKDPYLMTMIIATISLGVVVPVLKEKKLLETSLGQTVLLVTVISDFVTMILLAIYISTLSKDTAKLLFLLIFFILVFVTYRLIKRFLKGTFFAVLHKGTVQIGTRAVFALILMFVVLSESIGVENILGAFLAGVIVSLLAPKKEFVHQLDSFGYGFLIPIFFVMVGVKLDIRLLLTDVQILLFIPVLLVALYVSKMIPVLLLKRWFSWREVIGSGILLSSTLSLVIAAATVALEIGIIDEALHGALILVAIISCLISPVFFNKIFPKIEPKKKVIAIVGANHVTLPVSQDLKKEGYEVELYSAQPTTNEKDESKEEKYRRFPLVEVPDLSVESLQKSGLFNADVLVLGTMDDEVNLGLAEQAKSQGIQNIVVRIEDPEMHEPVQQRGFVVLSTLFAARMLLKAMIEHPSAVQLMTQHDDSIQEVKVQTPLYDHVLLSRLPCLGDTLVLRIYRGDSFIIPHGSTVVRLGDRLLVSGPAEHIQAMKRELE
jgi:CPA2 family monovalent cation:H+ antiporter-2